MNPSGTPINRRLIATLWTAFAALSPLPIYAESVVFDANFSGGGNTARITPSVITPTGTTWYGAYNKGILAASLPTALEAGANGLILAAPGSTSAVIQVAARITQAPIALTQVGDYIKLEGSFYTAGLTNIAIGFFNSGGVDPLVMRSDGVTEMLNNGLGTAVTTELTGGTRGWTGYRAMSLAGSTTANFVARPAQTSQTTANAAAGYELLSVGTGAYSTPVAVAVGTVSNSSTSVPWKLENALVPYDYVYRIQRSSATAFAFTFTITNQATAVVVYSTSGSTTNAGALPSAITSSFDALSLGGRVDTGQGNPVGSNPSNAASVYLQYTAIKVTAVNSDIAKIVTPPTAQNFPNGLPGSLTVVGGGTGPLSYQWYKDGSELSGQTSATYSVGSASPTDVGQYHVVVRNAFGSETSAAVQVNVSGFAAPAITTEPTAQVVDAGTMLTLAAVASGVPTPSYQWFKNNVEVPGATSATYTVANALEANAGNYKVVATNSQGSATSATVAVTINTAAPVITVPPAPVTVNVGAEISLSVTATGLPAPTYQWFKGGVAIPGATSAIYSIGSALSTDAGSYTVTATNPYGAPTSSAVAVTVNVVAPSVTTQPPATLTVTAGRSATLIAAYAGSLPRTYQWYKDTTLIPGATGTSYVIPAATAADAGNYHVVVTNEGSSGTSNTTVVSVAFAEENAVFATSFAGDTLNNAAAPITSTSTSWFIMAGRAAKNSSVGDDATTLDVVEARPLTVTWETPAGSAVVETAARFSATPIALSAPGQYLRVRATMRPTNVLNLCFGVFNSGGVSPLPLDGSNATASTMSNTDAVGLGTQNWIGYRSALTVGGSGGDIGTRPPQVEASTNRGQELVFPAGSTGGAFGQPVGVSVGVVPGLGATVVLTSGALYTLDYTVALTAANQYSISYSLYAGSSATGTPVYTTYAVTSAAGALPSAVTSAFDALAFGIRNQDAATVPSLVISDLSVVKGTVVVPVAPSITTPPASQSLAPGATLTLTAVVSGTPAPTFQWLKNDVAIPGATSATYTIGSVITSDSGAYKVVATNAAGSATSDAALVTVASASAYATWATGQGLTVGGNDGVTQDPDNDSVKNLLEFVFGGHPLTAGTAMLPVVTSNGTNLTLTFDLKIAAKSEYVIGVESSTDLITWSPVADGVAGAVVSETVLDGATNRVVATVPAGVKTFLRVKVSLKP